MKTISYRRATELDTKRLLAMADRETVVVTRNGRPFRALFALRGQDWESYVVSRSPVFKRAVARARRSYRKHGGVSLEEVKKRYGIR
jgi:hypothetical protein